MTLDLAHTLELGSSGLKRPCRSLNQILPVLREKSLVRTIDVEDGFG